MEMNGGSSAPYLARTPCVPLFCTVLDRGGNRKGGELHGSGLFAQRNACSNQSFSHGVRWVFANKKFVKRDGLHQMWA